MRTTTTIQEQSYTGIDFFRLVSALLIVAIHTSPLASVNETADFILTRVIARVGVPFFFMVTGFFTLSRYHKDNRALYEFEKKTARIYALAIALYLPVNLYTGYFSREHLLPNIIKDLVFDGTMYHLWYLPASMLGILLVWYLVKKLDFSGGLLVTAGLYLVGLMGDSYYGLAAKLPMLKSFYRLIFEVSDYTRNGLFLAPVFLLLGGLIREQKRRPSLPHACAGLMISAVLLYGEAMTLHGHDLQRHDSMYVFLVPCMYYLFQLLLKWKGSRIPYLRTLSLSIYLIHPMMILVVRAIAKLLSVWDMLVENSPLHFLTVCLMSVGVSCFAASWMETFGTKTQRRPETDRAYIELNLDHLTHNVKVIKATMQPGCKLMAVVKTAAYGHGAFEVATHLEKIGVSSFAVATIDEGIKLREYGIRGEILILGYTDVHRVKELNRHNLTQTILDFSYAKALNQQGVPVKVHLKVDTGMHRLGISDEDIMSAERIFRMRNLEVEGIFTHLSCCESLSPEDVEITRGQIERFYDFVEELRYEGVEIPKLHIQSSYGLLNYPELQCDYVRVGIALYGVLSNPAEKTRLSLDLRPVLALKARVALIREIPKGEYVGYDRAFVTRRDSRIAILPIGYGDGFPRNLSCENARVKIGNKFAPVVGKICMDQLAVDITDLEGVSVGDIVTLIDNTGDCEMDTPHVAGQSGSISNEILSRMGARLPVVCVSTNQN